MKFAKDMEGPYKDWLAKNQDPYGNRCFTYAEDWAKFLEARIPADATEAQVMRVIVDHAEEDSRTADTDGITGFMYGVAVSILAKCWLYGEQLRRWQLRRWHNLKTQIKDEGEKANKDGSVLNPALLRIKASEWVVDPEAPRPTERDHRPVDELNSIKQALDEWIAADPEGRRGKALREDEIWAILERARKIKKTVEPRENALARMGV
jgi:hypothetical protein